MLLPHNTILQSTMLHEQLICHIQVLIFFDIFVFLLDNNNHVPIWNEIKVVVDKK
jgi:hypothetical protein